MPPARRKPINEPAVPPTKEPKLSEFDEIDAGLTGLLDELKKMKEDIQSLSETWSEE